MSTDLLETVARLRAQLVQAEARFLAELKAFREQQAAIESLLAEWDALPESAYAYIFAKRLRAALGRKA